MPFILCSMCFSDFGLIQTAIRLGVDKSEECVNCRSSKGLKLSREAVEELAMEFFVNGSWSRTTFGGSWTIQLNDYHFQKRDFLFPDWLECDAQQIEKALKQGFFLYGPPMWRVGYVDQLEALQSSGKERDKVLDQIFEHYPNFILNQEKTIFRLRSNLDDPRDPLQFDSAPPGKSKARFNNDGFPTLYGSEDLEICIHECRVTIADECYVATLRATEEFKCLDLTAEGPIGNTPFESLDLAIKFLMSAETASYEILTLIANSARKRRYDGILFRSYFSQLKSTEIPNLAIFGHPIRNGKIKVDSINRLHLDEASYRFSFGPVH